MGFQKKFFSAAPGDPAPLTATVERRVRFEEVDALGMVWHGRYPSYIEDGRIAFGDRFGLSYREFREAGVPAPVVSLHIDYLAPLRFDDIFTITTSLHWCEALRLNFSYLLSCSGQTIARASTVQLLTELDGRLLLLPPPFILNFREKWQQGTLL